MAPNANNDAGIDVQQAWRLWHTTHNRGPVLVGTAVALVAFTSFAFIDRTFHATASALHDASMVRAGVVGILILIFAARASVVQGRLGDLCGPALLLTITFGVSTIAAILGGASTGYHDEVALGMLGYGASVPTRLRTLCILYALSIAYCYFAFYAMTAPGTEAAGLQQLFILVTTALLGLGTVWLKNRAQVREIALTMQAKLYTAQLERLDNAKNAFFANVSHELRTPLMLVLASVDNLQDELNKDGKHTHQFGIVSRNGEHLLHMVDELLELSRLESDVVHLRPTAWRLGELLQDIADRAAQLAKRKEITLSLQCPADLAEFMADKSAIERLVLNLLANALKFTPVGGRITIAVRQSAHDVEVVVSDSGVGIAPEELPHVFERFRQGVSGKSVHRGGVGIGLSMCMKIVELHKGSIWIESQPGTGTQVHFKLPFIAPSAVAPSDTPTTNPRMQRPQGLPEWDKQLRERDSYRMSALNEASERRLIPRGMDNKQAPSILIVDDNAHMAELVGSMLASEYNVFAASDGEEGLERARRFRPAVIISDVMMPKMSGFDMLAAIRSDPSLKDTPVIMMTARGLASDRHQANAFEADEFLPKPFSGKDLRPILTKLLNRQQSHIDQTNLAVQQATHATVSGLAHEIMNPVSFVKNAAFTLQRSYDDLYSRSQAANIDAERSKQSFGKAMEVVRSGLLRITEAVNQLRSYAHGQTSTERVVVPITPVVQRTMKVTAETARLSQDLQARSSVALRPGQLERVILNLMINAIQAGGDGCEITVATRDDPDHAQAIVEVIDKGPGMDAATLKRIFEPGFTTKATGSGLGLAMCREIVADHGGRLDVSSAAGQGSTFTITLPTSEPTGAAALEA